MWFSAQISNYAKVPWNTQKTPTKHVLRLFKKFLKIRFSAKKSGSRPRCRTMLKILWNTQKTPSKHALRYFKKFFKIRFLAEKSGSRLRCRIMIKYHETLRKHQLNMFWDFLRNSWKSGSWLKNPANGKDHHGVSSGWSSVWHRSNTGLSSTQYEQIPIILGVWPFWLTPFFFRSITFWRAYG